MCPNHERAKPFAWPLASSRLSTTQAPESACCAKCLNSHDWRADDSLRDLPGEISLKNQSNPVRGNKGGVTSPGASPVRAPTRHPATLRRRDSVMKCALFVLLALSVGALSSGCNAIGRPGSDLAGGPGAYPLGVWEGYCEGGACGHAGHVNVGHVEGEYIDGGLVDGAYVDGGCGCSDGSCEGGTCDTGCCGDCATDCGGCGSCANCAGHGPGGLLGELGFGSGRIASKFYRHCANGHQNLAAGPQYGAVTYPYYTVRGPRDFLNPNPPSIGP